MEWGNRLGLHVLIMDRSKNKMTGVRVSGSVTVEALLISLDPEAQKAAVAVALSSGLTPRAATTPRAASAAFLPQIHESSMAGSYASSAASSSSPASPYTGPTASGWASGVASTGAAGANVATEASPAGVLARGGVASVSDASAAPSSDVEETSPREGQGLVDDELQSLLVPST